MVPGAVLLVDADVQALLDPAGPVKDGEGGDGERERGRPAPRGGGGRRHGPGRGAGGPARPAAEQPPGAGADRQGGEEEAEPGERGEGAEQLRRDHQRRDCEDDLDQSGRRSAPTRCESPADADSGEPERDAGKRHIDDPGQIVSNSHIIPWLIPILTRLIPVNVLGMATFPWRSWGPSMHSWAGRLGEIITWCSRRAGRHGGTAPLHACIAPLGGCRLGQLVEPGHRHRVRCPVQLR